MIGIIKKLAIVTVTLSSLLFFLIAVPMSTQAADPCDTNSDGSISSKEAIQCGTQGAAGTDQNASTAGKNIDNTITKFVNVFSVIIGVIAVIMIIVGGFRYITSAGNTEKLSQAKNTILYALIGLIVVALAQVLAIFVLDKATQTDKTKPKSSSTPSAGPH